MAEGDGSHHADARYSHQAPRRLVRFRCLPNLLIEDLLLLNHSLVHAEKPLYDPIEVLSHEPGDESQLLTAALKSLSLTGWKKQEVWLSAFVNFLSEKGASSCFAHANSCTFVP